MRVIIVGAGRVGKNLSKILSEENHEVYLIDNNEPKARKVLEKLDVKGIIGNGADPETLAKAQVSTADLVLAVTTSDETNLVVCSIAAVFGAKRRIARVRSRSLSAMLETHGYSQFSIDEMINPELLAANAIVKLVETPGASEVADFAEGRILLRGFDVPITSPLCGLKIEDFSDDDFPWPFLIISIIRKKEVIIPRGDTFLQSGDHIYVLLPAQSIGEFLTFVNPDIKKVKKVLIYGASITGKQVAQSLLKKVKEIVLIEEDEKKAREVASEIESVTIINGSASDADILIESGVEVADTFIATSNNDHSNLVSSVLAKKMGAKETIILTQQPEYMSMVDVLDISAIINPHSLAVEQILHLIRGGTIRSAKLLDCNTEAIELIAEDGAAITKDILRNLKIPKTAIIGAVYSESKVSLANGNTRIVPGEKVIIFCQESCANKLQELFKHK